MRKTKITLIIQSPDVGGVEKRFFNLFKKIYSLTDNQPFLYIFYFNRRFLYRINAENNRFKNLNAQIIVFGINQKWKDYLLFNICSRLLDLIHLWLLLLLKNIISRTDIVHFVTTNTYRFLPLFANTKKVGSFYNSDYTYQELKEKRYCKILREDIYWDCLSSDISDVFIHKFKFPQRMVFTSPCSFIDMDETCFDPLKKEKIISFVARFEEQKGVTLLLKSLKGIITYLPDIKFQIIGYGSMERQIILFIKENNLQNNIDILFTPNPKQFLVKSIIFLSLQDKENYPSQSLLEAMACGNAIVATNVGLTNLLVDNSNGVLINKNEFELVSAIVSLVSDYKSTLSKGINSREKVLSNHSVDIFLRYLNNLYMLRLKE